MTKKRQIAKNKVKKRGVREGWQNTYRKRNYLSAGHEKQWAEYDSVILNCIEKRKEKWDIVSLITEGEFKINSSNKKNLTKISFKSLGKSSCNQEIMQSLKRKMNKPVSKVVENLWNNQENTQYYPNNLTLGMNLGQRNLLNFYNQN